MSSVGALLAAARQRLRASVDDPLLEAQILLAHALGRERSWLYAWPEHEPEPAQRAVFERLLQRREQGEPVAHLVGRREFWSLPLTVDASTLVPRPETELLVETVLRLDLPDAARVLDLGTGSGAIALALAHERPAWRITATDASDQALAVARDNAERFRLDRVRFAHGSWFAAVDPAERFDLIVSNPPYVAEDDPHLERGDLRFEPRGALAAGPDGLDDIRRIIALAPTHLQPGGHLWLEHGYDQGAAVRDLLGRGGFSETRTVRDLGGQERCSGGRLRQEPNA